MGDACPIPVVKTKNAIKEMGTAGGTVETFVDNEIAVQNLTKMANQKGYGVQAEQLESNKYRVVMTVGVQTERQVQENAEQPVMCAPMQTDNTVVVISSACMGTGDDALGAVLMKGFIYALSQQDKLPKTILFYNGGAKLTCEGAVTLEDLKSWKHKALKSDLRHVSESLRFDRSITGRHGDQYVCDCGENDTGLSACKAMIYLDSAATSFYKPKQVEQAVCCAFHTIGNAGRGAHAPTLEASRVLYRTRAQAGAVVSCGKVLRALHLQPTSHKR